MSRGRVSTKGTSGAAGADTAEEAAPAHAPHQVIHDVAYSFEGPFGKYDQFQLQRGLQVYTEVCAGCHGMKQVPLRTLHDAGGPGLPEDQVRAYAAAMSVMDPETGEERPRLPTDFFPTVSGDGMGPDLSLMAKARAGFHGPYGTGISQLMNGIGGPEYIHAILNGYTGEQKEEAGSVLYENTAFASGWIAMPPPLQADQVAFADGAPADPSAPPPPEQQRAMAEEGERAPPPKGLLAALDVAAERIERFHAAQMPQDMVLPEDGLMLGILAAFAEFERRRIKERQAEGIALAKARGKYVQAPKLSDTDVEQARVMIEMGIPKAEVARTFGVSRQTLYTSLARGVETGG